MHFVRNRRYLAGLLAAASVACVLLWLQGQHHAHPAWTRHKVVAHALGGIGEHTYTNSREAFELNYQKGFRLFEVDLQATSDGHLVARHDWSAFVYKYLEQDVAPDKVEKPLTLAEYSSLKINKLYSGLSAEELMQLLATHRDAYIITDTKDWDPALVTKEFGLLVASARKVDGQVLERMIPQIYTQQMLRDIESIHHFDSYIYTLYASPDSDAQVLEFIRKNDKIAAVTIHKDRVTAAFARAIKAEGREVYSHTTNDLEEARTQLAKGVDGLYTDFISPEALAGLLH